MFFGCIDGSNGGWVFGVIVEVIDGFGWEGYQFFLFQFVCGVYDGCDIDGYSGRSVFVVYCWFCLQCDVEDGVGGCQLVLCIGQCGIGEGDMVYFVVMMCFCFVVQVQVCIGQGQYLILGWFVLCVCVIFILDIVEDVQYY